MACRPRLCNMAQVPSPERRPSRGTIACHPPSSPLRETQVLREVQKENQSSHQRCSPPTLGRRVNDLLETPHTCVPKTLISECLLFSGIPTYMLRC